MAIELRFVVDVGLEDGDGIRILCGFRGRVSSTAIELGVVDFGVEDGDRTKIRR
jgi:hypothetical protein